MNISIGMMLGAQRPGAATPFTPAALSGLIAAPIIKDCINAGGKLWQNAGKTVPAVADGDPVRVIVCPYTGIETVAISDLLRGILKISGAFSWIARGIGTVYTATATVNVNDCTIATATDGGDTASVFGNSDMIGARGTDGIGRIITQNTQGILLGGIGAVAGSGAVGQDVVVVRRSGGVNTLRQNGVQTIMDGSAPNASTIIEMTTTDADKLYGMIVSNSLSGGDLINVEAYLDALMP